MRTIFFNNRVVFISNAYKVQIITNGGKTQEEKLSLKVPQENQLTWSQEKGFAYTFTINLKGEYILTKSSFWGGGSGPRRVLLEYERGIFTWIEINSGCKYIFRPIKVPSDNILYCID